MPDRYSSISIDTSSRPQPPKRSKPHRRRDPFVKKISDKIPRNPYVIIASIAGIFFGLYCLGGFLLIPYLIKNILPGYVAKHTRLELNIGSARFNPFSFRLQIKDATVLSNTVSTKESPLLKTDELVVDLVPSALIHGNIVTRSLQIERPALTLIRYQDNVYNVSLISKASFNSVSNRSSRFPDIPFLFSFNNISVTDGSLIFNDRLLKKVHKAEKIELTLPTLANFSYKSKTSVLPSFSAVINGSPIQLTGEAAIPNNSEGNRTQLSFNLKSLDLPLYFNYLPSSFPVQLIKGTADGQIQISFIPKKDHSQSLTVLFQLDTKYIDVSTKDNALEMSIPTAKLEGEFQPFTGDLHFRNILFNEPEILLNHNFSEQTLDGLLPYDGKASPAPFPQKSAPKLALDLFVMDDGILHIEEGQGTKLHKKTYRSIQLSIKNFADHQTTKDDTDAKKCTFKLSGEQLSPQASFSWEGDIDQSHSAHGTLHLNHFPASLLGTIFTREQGTSMSGISDMTGDLSVQRKSGASKPFSYSISEGSIKISDFHLLEAGKEWLSAVSFTLGPLDSKNKILDIGNMYFKDAVVKIQEDHLPHFLKSFAENQSPYRVHGIDFSGDISLNPAKKNRPSLVFTGLSIQANHLDGDPKDTDNFSLTGKIVPSGELKTKGRILLNPFKASLTVQFSRMPSERLFPWYTDSSYLLDGKGLIDGLGQLSYPSGRFSGSLTFSEALFDNISAKSRLTWKTAEFKDFDFSTRPFRLKIASILINQPELTYSQQAPSPSVPLQVASFLQSLLPHPKTGKGGTKPPVSDFKIPIISITNGRLIYKDPRLTPPWQQEVTSIAGDIQNLSRPVDSSPCKYIFTGTIASRPLTAEGTIDPFARKISSNSTLTLTGMPLSIYKNQLLPLLSLDTDTGTFDLTLQEAFQDGHATGQAQYVFHGLSPASESADTALMLSLLADTQDTIKARISLNDQESNEQQPVFTSTVNYFKRLIVKSVIAPLLLTNDNFARLTFDDTPDFVSGEKSLSEKGKAKLTLFRDLLASHPRLTLDITGMADTTADRNTLLEKRMKADYLIFFLSIQYENIISRSLVLKMRVNFISLY